MNVPAIVLSHKAGGLGAVRALGRRGVQVIAIADQRTDLVLHSRFPAKSYLLSGNNDDENESELLQILSDLPDQGAVILTSSDLIVELISEHRQDLAPKYRLALPSRETLQCLNDKRQETKLIASLGFNVPKTVQELPATPDALKTVLRLPIIFKPYSFVAQRHFTEKNAVVESDEALVEFYDDWKDELAYFVAQEVIPGPDSYSWVCSCTFDRNHELLDCAIKQKLRTNPPHFGGSCYAVSRVNAEILELARALGRKLNYTGHASIEFRWDGRDKCYKYIEVNPRLPENVAFDEACGMPTVWNSYKVSQDGLVSGSRAKQKEGVHYWSITDDFFSLREDKSSNSQILGIFFAMLFKRTSGLYFAWDDPKPAIVVAYRFVRQAVRFIVKKIRPRSVVLAKP